MMAPGYLLGERVDTVKVLRWTLWLLVVLILAGIGDRLLMEHPFETPGIKPAQQFYRDFRERLLSLHRQDILDDQIGQAIEAQTARPATEKSSRYLYVDRDGVLQFADSLQQVPAAYRQSAQPLAD